MAYLPGIMWHASGRLDLSDDQALSSGPNCGPRHLIELVDVQDSLHLRQRAVQETEVAARDADG